MYYTINARNCTEYLRSIGVEVSEDTAQTWAEQEKVERRRRRVHKAELKRSCGHFRTHQTRIYSEEGAVLVTYCSECRVQLRSVPLTPNAPAPPHIA